jgi:dTDP-glucose pyrophosphorylase
MNWMKFVAGHAKICKGRADMRKMTIIITMAGLGSRFRKAGYDCPKYMIEAKEKTLFEWSMDSLVGYNDIVSKYVFVVRKEDNASAFITEKCKFYGIENIDIVEIADITDGQATTCLKAISFCDADKAIMVYNIDTYVEPYELKYSDIHGDGFIPCFHSAGEHWSFVRADNDGKVTEVREKQRISDNCSIGAYYFSTAELYKDLYEVYYSEERMEKNEKYIAPLYNLMIKRGMSVEFSIIEADRVHILGTPEELQKFIED